MLGVFAQAVVDFGPLLEVLPGARASQHAKAHFDAFEAVTGLPPIQRLSQLISIQVSVGDPARDGRRNTPKLNRLLSTSERQ